MILHESKGILHYSYDNVVGFRLVVNIDRGIYFFYQSLIPKYLHVQPQAHVPHISVVRKEEPTELDYWEKYQNNKVCYSYDPIIKNDDRYWWLDVYSTELDAIRRELGLKSKRPWSPLPLGYENRYHITIGNTKYTPVLGNTSTGR